MEVAQSNNNQSRPKSGEKENYLGLTCRKKRENKLGQTVKIKRRINLGPINLTQNSINNIKLKIKGK
jgi:hypothetical protein